MYLIAWWMWPLPAGYTVLVLAQLVEDPTFKVAVVGIASAIVTLLMLKGSGKL